MAKLKAGEKRVQLSFQRPDDLKLFSFMEKESYRCRWDLQNFILASLQEAFKDRIEEDEVSAMAEEAARKVRERTVVPAMTMANEAANSLMAAAGIKLESPPTVTVGTSPKQEPPFFDDNPNSSPVASYIWKNTAETEAPKPSPVSMDQAMQQAEAQIAALNPPGRTLKRGKVPAPEMPKEK
jgi:hypothetical protein